MVHGKQAKFLSGIRCRVQRHLHDRAKTLLAIIALTASIPVVGDPIVVKFPNGDLTLGGELYLPPGEGPFPIVLFNHGSAPGMANSQASAAIGPKFVEQGWAFFMPYRRGQGLSADQGPYIMDEIRNARWNPFADASKKLVELQTGDHLSDQMAAFNWLLTQPFVDADRIASLGNSFGGIQVLLGMASLNYCAGVDASGGAESWAESEDLRDLLKDVVTKSKGPIFFFQAENDYDLRPSMELAAIMKNKGKRADLKIYPKFGKSNSDGHSFPYRGVSIWFQDALEFMNTHCQPARSGDSSAP